MPESLEHHRERRRAYRARKAAEKTAEAGLFDGVTSTPGADAPAQTHAAESIAEHVFEIGLEWDELRHRRALERAALEEEDRLLELGVEPWAAIAEPEHDRERADRLKRQILAQAAGREPEPTPETTRNGRTLDSPEWNALTFAEKFARYGHTDGRVTNLGPATGPRHVKGFSTIGETLGRVVDGDPE